MSDPQARLDERFSDDDASATRWETARAELEAAQIFWITTVRADGRPHVTPLVAVWLDETLHFSTGVGEQKELNLNANPHVVLTTGKNTWNEGLDLVVEGVAERVTDRARLERLAAAWTGKWDGQWQYKVSDGGFVNDRGGPDVQVFAVRADKIFAFGKGAFTQTVFRPAG